MPGHPRISDEVSSTSARPVLAVLRPGEARPPCLWSLRKGRQEGLVRRSQQHSSLWPHGSGVMDGSGRQLQVRGKAGAAIRLVTGSWDSCGGQLLRVSEVIVKSQKARQLWSVSFRIQALHILKRADRSRPWEEASRGLWKDPETTRPGGTEEVSPGKCLDSAELGSAHWGSLGGPQGLQSPNTGALPAEESAPV